jgi:hypothetical protein
MNDKPITNARRAKQASRSRRQKKKRRRAKCKKEGLG